MRRAGSSRQGWPREVNLAVHDPVVIDGAARAFMGRPQNQFQFATLPASVDVDASHALLLFGERPR
ncbi:hypothetical protein AGR1_17915 [Agrobacterium sp. B1(2019)]|nr:hypothetical protein AGR1_17915 [Agrobacterium sp. B1(2019)]